MAHEHDYHPPGLQHQFEDMKQQQDSVTVGMWAFLVQEIMFFGGLFTVYLVFRSRYPMAFAAGSNHLDVVMGFVNTLVLIVSSLTMALTVYFAQKSNRNMQVIMIVLTMIFGTTFLVVKYFEYSDKYHHGLVPIAGLNQKTKDHETPIAETSVQPSEQTEIESREKNSLDVPTIEKHEANPRGEFRWHDEKGREIVLEAKEKNYLTPFEKSGYFTPNKSGELIYDNAKFTDKVRIFFWIYFVMTGLHALHMIVGLGIMTWLLIMAWRNTYSAEYYAPVEISGLYWHFVDIVWIFLFPLLYLLGRHFLAGGH